MKRNQSGFTLIEIAIVLVIIGLLLGGVLKGQELINSAKVKNLANDFKNVPVFIYGYQDKFKALPGDQPQSSLDAQFPPANTATVCTPAATAGHCVTNNGVIDGGWDSTSVADESFVFWQHVRLAGFGPGATNTAAADYLPKNAVNGFIGVTNAAQSPITNLRGTYIVCSDAIPGKFALQLDTTLDNGDTSSGSVMVVAAGTPTTTPVAAVTNININPDTTYLVCMGY
jgi:prepilin-type N-terminal cleavage/methylation domain-containing protein